MTFPMAKTPFSQLTFITQAEIQVQEASPKEKKRKKNVNDIPNGKKEHYPAYLHSPSQIQVQEAPLKKKKEKGTLMTFLMVKKNTTQLTFIAQVSRKHPLKKKKKKEH